MRAKLVIAAFLVISVAAVGDAYVHGYPPFPSQFLRTCDKAIKERLAVPSTYQRIDVDESRKTITFDEFFIDPLRGAISAATREAIVRHARVQPVQYVALIDYQAQDAIGAIIRERSSCTFNSLEGDDTPTRTSWIEIDDEHNMDWAARQPKAAALKQRMMENW